MTSAPSARIRRWLEPLASLRLALWCMGLSLILVFWGTMAQVHLGTYNAQKIFFNSFVVFQNVAGWNCPVFPGGLTIGLLWLINLLAAFVVRFRLHGGKFGLFVSHAGLVLLLAGQLLTQLYTIETQMPIQIGQSLNYSESYRETELVLIDRGHSEYDEVTRVPISRVQKKGTIVFPRLPFELRVREFYPNAQLSMNSSNPPSEMRGIGSKIQVEPQPVATHEDDVNNVTAVLEVIDQGQSQGVWLVSSGLGAPQGFNAAGRTYEIAIRPRRNYTPFTLTLKEFHHDVYPGTDIPKNFSSLVQLGNPDTNEWRDALIYMNHPLRYQGKTFYQASFGNNDTLSIFQVVENPFAVSPYIACAMVLIGLAIHFLVMMVRFLRRSA